MNFINKNIISHTVLVLISFFQASHVIAVDMEISENPECFIMSCPLVATFKPALPSGDMLKIFYNGNLVATVKSQEIGITRLSTSVEMSPSNTHDIVVQHIDSNDKILNTKKTEAIPAQRKRGGWTWKPAPGKHAIKRFKYRDNIFRIDFDSEQIMSSYIEKATVLFDVGSITITMNGRMPENPFFTMNTDRNFGEMKVRFKSNVDSKSK